MPIRFTDQNKRLTDFQTEVWVMCPNCAKKAIAKVDYELKKATLFCESFGFNKQSSTEATILGVNYPFAKDKWASGFTDLCFVAKVLFESPPV